MASNNDKENQTTDLQYQNMPKVLEMHRIFLISLN